MRDPTFEALGAGVYYGLLAFLVWLIVDELTRPKAPFAAPVPDLDHLAGRLEDLERKVYEEIEPAVVDAPDGLDGEQAELEDRAGDGSRAGRSVTPDRERDVEES